MVDGLTAPKHLQNAHSVATIDDVK